MKKKHVFYLALLVILILIIAFLFKPVKTNNADLASFRLIDFFKIVSKVKPTDKQMQVAVASIKSFKEKEKNLKQIKTISMNVISDFPETKLILFGESSLGLYYTSESPKKYQMSIAESIPGDATDWVSGLAKQLNVHIAFGLIENAEGTLYNALVVIDNNGRIIGKHRKMLLHYYDDLNGVAQAEPNVQVVEIEGLKFGLSICADANSKWLINKYKEEKIDVLLYSITSKVPAISTFLKYWPFSKRFDSWILAANRSGTEGDDEYPGTVFIAGPNGAIHKLGHIVDSGYIVGVIGK